MHICMYALMRVRKDKLCASVHIIYKYIVTYVYGHLRRGILCYPCVYTHVCANWTDSLRCVYLHTCTDQLRTEFVMSSTPKA